MIFSFISSQSLLLNHQLDGKHSNILWYTNPSGKNCEKDIHMSEKSRPEENQVQTYIVVWFPETWLMELKHNRTKKKLKIEQWWVFTRYASPFNWTLSLSKSADYEALETYTLDISCVEVSLELYCVLAYFPTDKKLQWLHRGRRYYYLLNLIFFT